MKKLSLRKWISGILSGIIGLLGFSTCDSEKDPMPVMYGVLAPAFEIKGKVVQKENTEQAIPGIQVVSYPVYEEKEYKEFTDTLFTDSEGEFIIEDRDGVEYRIIFDDIDGEQNGGTFKRDTVDVSMSHMAPEDVEYDQEKRRYQYKVTFELERDNQTE